MSLQVEVEGKEGVPVRIPTSCHQTYLEVHLRDVVEPFIRSGFAVARSEACKSHFWQHRSRLGVHLPHACQNGYSNMQGAAVFLHELYATHQVTRQRSHRIVVFA